MGEKGFSILIDGTLSGATSIRDVLRQTDVPYFTFDYSVQSYLRMLQEYLIERKALDAVIIFQDGKSCEESLYNFIMNSQMRVILLDQLRPSVVYRLKTLRPAPNYYAIIADTVNMNKLFKIVRHNLNYVALFVIANLIRFSIPCRRLMRGCLIA